MFADLQEAKTYIGAMAVTIEKIKNRRGEIIEAYEKVTVIGRGTVIKYEIIVV